MATPAVSLPPPCPTSPRLTPREPPCLQQDRFAANRRAGGKEKGGSTADRTNAKAASAAPSSRRSLTRAQQRPTRGARHETVQTASKKTSRKTSDTISSDTISSETALSTAAASYAGASTDAPDATGAPLTSFEDVNRLLWTNPNLLRDALALGRLCTTLGMFLDANRVASASPNLLTGAMDRLDRVVSLCFDLHEAIRQGEQQQQQQQFNNSAGSNDSINSALLQLHMLLLQVFKVLLRKQPNRAGLGAVGVRGLGMLAAAAQKTHVACEGSNAVLNMCYEACNVSLLVDEIGVAFLVRFLHSNDTALQASAAGALQSICFQYMGRVACREENAIQRLVQLMYSEDNTVCTRVVGALHNLSSDPISLRPMREAGCLPGLVKLLGACSPMACAAAAGTIQNISREPASRELLLHKHAAVEPLSDLLFGSDVQAQACAAGALLNIVGPDLGGDGGDGDIDEKVDAETRAKNVEARTAFKKLLAESIAMGTIWQSLFEDGEGT